MVASHTTAHHIRKKAIPRGTIELFFLTLGLCKQRLDYEKQYQIQ